MLNPGALLRFRHGFSSLDDQNKRTRVCDLCLGISQPEQPLNTAYQRDQDLIVEPPKCAARMARIDEMPLDRTNPKVYRNRGLLFVLQNEFDSALRDAERALQFQPGDLLPHAIRGEVLRRRGDYAAAAAEFDKALSSRIEEPRVERAVRDLRESSERAKRCGDADLDLSIGACTSIVNDDTITKDARAFAYNQRAVAHGRNENWAQVLRDHDESIRLNGTSPVFFANRAVAHMRLGSYDEAAKDFDRSLALDPKSTTAINGQGLTARQQRDYPRAIERFTLALAYLPASATDIRAIYLGNRGLTYLLMEKHDDALIDLNRALSIDPKSAFALFARGVVKIRRGDAAGGEADIAAAKTIQSDIEAFMAKRHLTR